MHIGQTNMHYCYHIRSVHIPESDEVLDLGILTDKNLTYRSIYVKYHLRLYLVVDYFFVHSNLDAGTLS